MAKLVIDPQSAEPPFAQLRQQLIDQIMSRHLPAGSKLPSVRQLAADVGLAANTVARTYKELEAEGYVITRGRHGTIVAPVAQADAETQRRADELTVGYVAQMRALGYGEDAIVLAVRQAL